MSDKPETKYVTPKGRELTDADIEALSDEAEQGYDVSNLPPSDPKELERLRAMGRSYREQARDD
jgi:hypothetical protein